MKNENSNENAKKTQSGKNPQRRLRRLEKEERINFLKKVRSAPSSRAPVTDKTGAYYRFSKKYPKIVDNDGFKINVRKSPAKKKFRIAGLALVCAIFFCAGIILTMTGIQLSNKPAEDSSVANKTEDGEYIIPFSYNEWANAGAREELYKEWRDKGVTGLMLTLKAPDGTVPYAVDGDVLPEILTELKKAGFDTAAYIACLRDTSYAAAYPGRAVTVKDSGGMVLYTDGFAYINPFDEDGISYVTEFIKSFSDADFTYFILDDISLPVGAGDRTPEYAGYTGEKNGLNKALEHCVKKFSAAAGSSRVIFVTDVYGFYTTDNVAGLRYEGRLFPSTTKRRGVDVRISQADVTGKDPLGIIEYLRTVPDVFILESVAEAVSETPGNMPLYALCDKEQDAELIRSAGVNRIIVTGK